MSLKKNSVLACFYKARFLAFIDDNQAVTAKVIVSHSAQGDVFCVDEVSGGLELCHHLSLSSQVYPGPLGAVSCVHWTPDGCALAMAWQGGGFSVWSTFGALLVCSLGWDYGLHVDLAKHNPLNIIDMVSNMIKNRIYNKVIPLLLISPFYLSTENLNNFMIYSAYILCVIDCNQF